MQIGFESSALVNTGDVLLKLDTVSEDAQLASAKAAAVLAKADLARVRTLDKRKLVSREAVDSAEAQVKETVAQVGNIRALIAKKAIRAPFSGRLGLRLVNLGQILGEDDPIVSLQTLDPIYVDFSIPQQEIRRLGQGMEVRVSTDVAVNPEVDPVTRNVRVRALVANL